MRVGKMATHLVNPHSFSQRSPSALTVISRRSASSSTLTSPASRVSITPCPASLNLLRLAPHQLMSGVRAGGGDVSKKSDGGIAGREERGQRCWLAVREEIAMVTG
jgi:hypothetical protein